jgi:hypothetical protein
MDRLRKGLTLVALCSVASCGTLPAGTVKPVRTPFTRPAATPPQVAPNAPTDGELQALLASFSEGPGSFESTYTTQERNLGEQKRSVYEMRFRATPRVSLLTVKDSTAIPRGFRVRDTGRQHVSVRLPPPASFVSFKVPAQSDQSKGLMGLYPDEVTPERFVQALSAPGSNVREVAGRTQERRSLRCFEGVAAQGRLKGYTLTLGVGDAPRFVYYLALKRRDGGSLVQTFTGLRARTFQETDLAI